MENINFNILAIGRLLWETLQLPQAKARKFGLALCVNFQTTNDKNKRFLYTLYAYIEQAKYIDIIGFKCKINRQLADGHTEIVARNYINNINQPAGIGEAILFLFTESGSPLMPYFLFSQFLAKKNADKEVIIIKGPARIEFGVYFSIGVQNNIQR